MTQNRSKNGQAMVEFLVGLVGILVLVLGLNQIANIVAYDFDNIFGVRENIADDLLASSTTFAPASYDPSSSYLELDPNINENEGGRTYEWFQENYPRNERTDQFEYLRNGGDPLGVMMGAQGGHTIEIESRLMQKVLGRSSILLTHEVWMPPWDDLQ